MKEDHTFLNDDNVKLLAYFLKLTESPVWLVIV